MKKTIPPATGAVLRFYLFSNGLNDEDFARRAGVKTLTVRRWVHGKVLLPPEQLIELLGEHLDVPPEAVEMALFAHGLGTLPEEPEGPGVLSKPERRLIGRAAAAGGRAGTETVRRELALERLRQRGARHAAWAEEKWAGLKKLPASLQDKAVRALQGGERSWALAVRLGEASCTAAAHSAAEALRLARLGVSLARAAPGSKRWRLLLLGTCEPFAANALRVSGNLDATRETFAHADEVWEEGKGGDPAGLLDGTRRLDLKASFLQVDGRTEEALFLLDQALQGARTDPARGRLLIMKATSLGMAGEYEASIETIQQAEPLVDARREPRLLFACVFNRAVNACHLDNYKAAEALLPRVEALSQDLRTELDQTRVRWLRGRARAGFGHKEEALAALSEVRRVFLAEQIAYDFALVSLELATLHLEQGRTGLVRILAEEMLWVFEGQRVHQEALAALALFHHAAQEEEVQAEWTRRLVKYLYRAQHNPSLQFEA
jgi:transcriptional regulator with XRE-family HTH domain